jgi:hypothetical protein
MWNLGRLVLASLHKSDESLLDDMVCQFVKRVFGTDLLNRYDPERGDIEGFLFGIMRTIAFECLRERSRRRIEYRSDQSLVRSMAPGPVAIAQRDDLLQRIREWAKELPPAQQNALARRYTALADLDQGGETPNEYVARHRALKYLRKRAARSDLRSPPG